MNTITRKVGDTVFTFTIKFEEDSDHGAPWDEMDGHGPVSEWTRRDKRAGELLLQAQHGDKRYFDFAAACKLALAEGWDAQPYNTGAETKRQQAAKAARANFDMLRGWCANEWYYQGVIVVLLDEEGDETDVTSSLWGVDNFDPNYPGTVAVDLVDELMAGYGKSWGKVTKETFGMLKATAA